MTRSRFITQVRRYASLSRMKGFRFDKMVDSIALRYIASAVTEETSAEDAAKVNEWVKSFLEREYTGDARLMMLPASKAELTALRRKS